MARRAQRRLTMEEVYARLPKTPKVMHGYMKRPRPISKDEPLPPKEITFVIRPPLRPEANYAKDVLKEIRLWLQHYIPSRPAHRPPHPMADDSIDDEFLSMWYFIIGMIIKHAWPKLKEANSAADWVMEVMIALNKGETELGPINIDPRMETVRASEAVWAAARARHRERYTKRAKHPRRVPPMRKAPRFDSWERCTRMIIAKYIGVSEPTIKKYLTREQNQQALDT